MADRRRPTWIRWAVDAVPAFAFLVVLLATRDFRLATWWLVGGSTLALVTGLLVERRLAPLPAVMGGMALVFGGLSLLLHRNDILQMKMTIVDAALGAVLFGGLLLKKNPLKLLLGGAFHLTDRAWTVLAVRYALFWWVCAAANEFIRRTQTAETWAIFRVVAVALAIVFAVAQTPFLMKHGGLGAAPPPDPPEPGF
ncbi:MAG TPA: septation protein IspZ [Caulobacteraceae bacterium]